ncbi:MAG: hypothetical protein Kow0077_20310 [Anaerolineae bacterium]
MSNASDQERERLQRLRDRQLQARDPGAPVKVKWKGGQPTRQEPLLTAIWRTLPGRGKGLLFGFLFGVVFSIVVTNAITAVVAGWELEGVPPTLIGALCGGAFFVVSMAVGMIIGKATEDEDTGI